MQVVVQLPKVLMDVLLDLLCLLLSVGREKLDLVAEQFLEFVCPDRFERRPSAPAIRFEASVRESFRRTRQRSASLRSRHFPDRIEEDHHGSHANKARNDLQC